MVFLTLPIYNLNLDSNIGVKLGKVFHSRKSKSLEREMRIFLGQACVDA